MPTHIDSLQLWTAFDWCPIDTNLHATSCQLDKCLLTSAETNNALPYPAVLKQTTSTHYMTPWQQAISPPFLRTSQATNQRCSWEDQYLGYGQNELKLGITIWDSHTTHYRLRYLFTQSSKPIGNDLTRHSLVLLVLITREPYETGYGRFKCNMNQMGLSSSASCECGDASQTTHHIATECPLHSCSGDLGHIEHCLTQLASRPAVCLIEEESSAQ